MARSNKVERHAAREAKPVEVPGERELGVPWSIKVYIGLCVVFSLMLVMAALADSAAQLLGRGQAETHAVAGLVTFSTDGLKTVVGALLGSLSVATDHHFRRSMTRAKSARSDRG